MGKDITDRFGVITPRGKNSQDTRKKSRPIARVTIERKTRSIVATRLVSKALNPGRSGATGRVALRLTESDQSVRLAKRSKNHKQITVSDGAILGRDPDERRGAAMQSCRQYEIMDLAERR